MFSRISAGTIWVMLAIAKALDPSAFIAFAMRTTGLPYGPSRAVGWAVIAAEACIGLLLLLPVAKPRLRALGLGVTLAISIGMAIFAVFVKEPHCGCFGGLVEATMGRRLLVSGALAYFASTSLLGAPTHPERRTEVEA